MFKRLILTVALVSVWAGAATAACCNEGDGTCGSYKTQNHCEMNNGTWDTGSVCVKGWCIANTPTATTVPETATAAPATNTPGPTNTAAPTNTPGPTSTPTSHIMAGHPVVDTNVPTLSSCGTSPSGVGNDAAFAITIGSGTVTACTVTFSHQWPLAPVCIVEDRTDGTAVYVSASSPSAITITAAADMAGDVIVGHCFGYDDGISWP